MYKIGNHVWDSPSCKLNKCFIYVSHGIIVFPVGSFIRNLCLIGDDYYTDYNNCTITKYY